MDLSLHRIVILVEMAFILIIAYCVWQKTLLPYTYLFAAMILGVSLAISIVKSSDRADKYIILQIFLVFFLLTHIYYLSSQNIIPFGDAYWDYAVVKTFAQESHVFVIHGMVKPTEAAGYSELTWYSGWPLLHTLGLSFCQVSGIDPFYLNLIIPSLFGFVSFALVYLLVEKLRIKLHFGKEITIFALLVYATSPEAIFWQMQFVKQSFAIVLFTLILYLLCVSTLYKPNRRYSAILIVLALLLVVSHHFTSFTVVSFLILFSAFLAVGRYVEKIKILEHLFWSPRKVSFLGIALLMCTFMFVWWDSFGNVIWPTVQSRLTRFMEILKNMQTVQFFVPKAYYPTVLRPVWIPPFLLLRDLIMYAPAFLGFLLILTKISKMPAKSFVVYSILTFGLIFLIDDVFFALEPLRVVLLVMPLLAFLSSVFYNKIRDRSKLAWKAIVSMVIILFVLSSFGGLWAHDFAPIHLYNPSINPIEIGEVTPYFIRLKSFFEHKIAVENLQTVRADSIDPLVYLLNPNEYDKIKSLPTENVQQLGEEEANLVCSFKDLNMYIYYGGIWTPIKTLEEAETVQYELRQYLNGYFNRVYSDGRNILWITPKNTS